MTSGEARRVPTTGVYRARRHGPRAQPSISSLCAAPLRGAVMTEPGRALEALDIAMNEHKIGVDRAVAGAQRRVEAGGPGETGAVPREASQSDLAAKH